MASRVLQYCAELSSSLESGVNCAGHYSESLIHLTGSCTKGILGSAVSSSLESIKHHISIWSYLDVQTVNSIIVHVGPSLACCMFLLIKLDG